MGFLIFYVISLPNISMKNLKLNIPVLVQNLEVNNVLNYHIKPLFFRYPVATNRRFDLALRQFQKEVRYYFKGFQLNAENAASLFWFMFNPELKFKQIYFHQTIRSQVVKGQISYVAFDLQSKTFVCLPSFNYYTFIPQKDTNGKIDLLSEVERVATVLFKDLMKQYGKELETNAYFSSKKEFFSQVDVSFSIQYDGFKFEKDAASQFFSRLAGNSDFNGAVEVEKVSIDLNSLYPNELQRAFLQEKMVERLYHSVYGRDNTPIVLVGKKGVGKHTLIQEVVFRFLSNFYEKHKGNQRPKIWQLDPTRVISGMSIVGWWQKRLESIIKYIIKPNPAQKNSDKLLIDNIIALKRIGRSAQNNMTMADLLKPYIEARKVQTILIASPEEWKILQEEDRRFADLFKVIRIDEPSIEQTIKIILEKRKNLESLNSCQITIKAIEQLLNIQRNYLKQEALPGSIIELLEKLAVKYRYKVIDAPEIRAEFETISGLNTNIFDSGVAFEKDQVKTEISKELVGQNEAVEKLANVIHLIKAKLTNPDKPNASFLLIGPTGVGKTQAAKVLAKYLLGSEDYLLRFDMNEYIDEYAVQRLIGDYYNPEGNLTGKVRYRPFGVVLLDEIEKAHPKVRDILLQVLDDGRLTDSLGRTVDFTNTIIIMTSNVGATMVEAQLGFDKTKHNTNAIYRKAVENKFRPEFVNRIDNIIIFNPLELEHIYGIARLQIKELLQRDGFVRRTTILNIDKDAIDWVARRGYNSKMGGRALKRQIEQDLTALSAEQLISTNFEKPILLEIKIENEQLRPHIQELQFAEALPAEWLPSLPNEKKGKRFLKTLLSQLERIELKINRLQGNQIGDNSPIINTENWEFYSFKEKISATKQAIQTRILGFRDNNYIEGPSIPLRFKYNEFIPKSDNYGRAYKENIKDRLFQKEALEELFVTHQISSNRFDSLQTELLESYLEVEFLQTQSKGFLKGKTDHIQLQLESCITDKGQKEMDYLLEIYEHLFTNLELDFKVYKKKNLIEAKGYAAFDLLKNESGVHLFYQAHQNPLPIKLILKTLNRKKNTSVSNFQVIRIYNSDTTMMDLRTQFSNDIHIKYPEFKLLLFAGRWKG